MGATSRVKVGSAAQIIAAAAQPGITIRTFIDFSITKWRLHSRPAIRFEQDSLPSLEKLPTLRFLARTMADMENPNCLGFNRVVHLVDVRMSPVEKLPDGDRWS